MTLPDQNIMTLNVPPAGHPLDDSGERMIPASAQETSIVFARHQYTYNFAAQFAPGKEILDAGCGTGYGALILASTARHVLAIDQHEEALTYCRTHYASPRIEFRQGNVAHIDMPGQFDVAISFQVIEHLPDPPDFVRRLKSCVRPGGYVLISTPNSRPATAHDNPFHTNEMTYQQFSALMADNFTEWAVHGIGYARRSEFRELLIRSPLYGWAKVLKRKSVLKKVAVDALGMNQFRVLNNHVERDAIDLLAICKC